MSIDLNEVNKTQNEDSRVKKNDNPNEYNSDKNSLSFKDWKTLKESLNNKNGKSQNKTNFKSNNKNSFNNNNDTRSIPTNRNFNWSNQPNQFGGNNYFSGNNGVSGIMPANNYNKMNFNNNFGMLGNNYNNFDNNSLGFNSGRNNNSFDNFNPNNNTLKNFNPSNNNFNNFNPNNFNPSNNNSFNNFNPNNNSFNNFNPNNNSFNNFNPNNNNFNDFNSRNNSFNNFNASNNFGISTNFGNSNISKIGRNRFNGPREDTVALPDSFFASDGIYRQKDLMQQPLLNDNPFRNDQKANQLLIEFDKSRYTKEDKKKKKGNTKPENQKNAPSTNGHQTTLESSEKFFKEPKVYVPNPKSKIDGKPYIPKPKVPEQNLEITKDEKKEQWKAYRQAMKPFKNREFYNAKRVVQRMGKKDPSELDEKQILRLANARQIMIAHKSLLTQKYSSYEKSEETKELGELYLLKKNSLKGTDHCNVTSKPFQNYGNFGESFNDTEAGRKILGGYTSFRGFVPGGIIEGSGNGL